MGPNLPGHVTCPTSHVPLGQGNSLLQCLAFLSLSSWPLRIESNGKAGYLWEQAGLGSEVLLLVS